MGDFTATITDNDEDPPGDVLATAFPITLQADAPLTFNEEIGDGLPLDPTKKSVTGSLSIHVLCRPFGGNMNANGPQEGGHNGHGGDGVF